MSDSTLLLPPRHFEYQFLSPLLFLQTILIVMITTFKNATINWCNVDRFYSQFVELCRMKRMLSWRRSDCLITVSHEARTLAFDKQVYSSLKWNTWWQNEGHRLYLPCFNTTDLQSGDTTWPIPPLLIPTPTRFTLMLIAGRRQW